LRKGYESGDLSQQRVTRLARLANHHKLNDESVGRWAKHAATITIKRLDDELRVVTLPGASRKPRPLSDSEWFASLRFAPGDTRDALLKGSLLALSSRPPANVFLRLSAPTDSIVAFRACLQSSRQQMIRQCQGTAAAPADEARQLPSLRLARLWMSRRSPLPDWLCLVTVLEEFAEEWDNPQRITRRPTDRINARDGWRCTAPGCTARELEVHHIVYQSHGGSDDASNLTSLCPFHHRMGEHGTLASVRGEAPLALDWTIGVEAVRTSYSCEQRAST
jgi:5-methylcytosine-specific restriction endonuclease McrA